MIIKKVNIKIFAKILQSFSQHGGSGRYDAKATPPLFIATHGRRPHAQNTAWATLTATQGNARFRSGNSKVMLRQRRPEKNMSYDNDNGEHTST